MDHRDARLVPAGIAPSNSGITGSRDVTGNAPLGLIGKRDQRKNGGRIAHVVRGAAPETVIDLRGDDQLAEVVTVTLNVDIDAPNNDRPTWDMLPPLVAFVSWGTDGGSNFAEVDVLRGQSLQLPASMLIVQVAIDRLPPLFDALPMSQLASVSGSVGYQPTGAGPAQRTRWDFLLPFGTPGDLDTMIVDVPRFARSLRLERSDSTAPIDVVLLGPSAVEVGRINSLDPNAVLPLHPLATQVQAQNLSGAPVLTSLVFQLAI